MESTEKICKMYDEFIGLGQLNDFKEIDEHIVKIKEKIEQKCYLNDSLVMEYNKAILMGQLEKNLLSPENKELRQAIVNGKSSAFIKKYPERKTDVHKLLKEIAIIIKK